MNFLDAFNDSNAQRTFNYADVQNNKALVMICYLIPILFFLPIVVNSNSAYCRFHSNQQLAWLIVLAVLGIFEGIFSIIPIMGLIINLILGFCTLIFTILLMIEAYNGKAIRIPLVGNFFNFF